MKVTQVRGSADTGGAPWALVESGMRPIVVTLLVALFVHFVPPMVPVESMISWLGLALTSDEDDSDAPQQEVLVPIDLDMFHDEAPAQEGVEDVVDEPPPEPEEAPEKIVVVPVPKPPEKAAPPPPAPKPKEPPKPEEPEKKPEDKPQAKRKLRLKGAFEEAADNNVARAEHPNVNIYIAGSELRKRDLSTMFGDLLNAVPEWKMLLGGTDIDPIADFDHVLISAPHMRKKARWVVARVEYNVPDKKMKEAIGIAAKRSKGKWLHEYKLPVASVDSNQRRVVLIENRHQLVVLPKGAEKQIPKLEKVGRFPSKPSAGIFIDMVTPANAFKSKFPFPKTIEKLTLRFSLAESGGYLIEVEMIDENEESAKKNASFLAGELEKIRPIPLVSLFTKKYFIGKPVFETEGEIIRAKAPVTRAQVARIMTLVKVWLKGREQAAKERRERKALAKKKPGKKGKRGRVKASPAEKKPAPKDKSGGLFDGMRERVNEE